ncbi:FKBP-type peptidyl-prolyl cis-trans isomerase [Tasmannia lanceolata]|uniref:FKBP-type peptidyl-prolyl cis-trans isomerase n=1 Tax=Tasmannia lanceolata TaxID=3420 RepID=UPI004063142D
MAIITSNPFPISLKPSPPPFLSPTFSTRAIEPSPFSTRAAEPDKENNTTPTDSTPSPTDDNRFENRLSQVRLRYRSGTGKKAELRKAKRSSKKGSGNNNNVFLPPVPLKESVSDGLKVDFGFSPYSERLNGRLAGLGLVALLLVELGSGKSLISYHAPPTLLIQIYTASALSAVFIKYEKERVSVWPGSGSGSVKE